MAKKEKKIKVELPMSWAVARFGKNRKTIARWCADAYDPMPHVKKNSVYYFDENDVNFWWERHSVGKAS